MLIAIGQEAGSDDNLLDIAGNIATTTVAIGSTSGNAGNTLQLDDTASLLAYLGSTSLQLWDESWTTITADNASSLITSEFFDGYTTIQAIPEPGTCTLVGLGLASLLMRRRRAK